MKLLSLLKHTRKGDGGGGGGGGAIFSGISYDDGPFFDLEFSMLVEPQRAGNDGGGGGASVAGSHDKRALFTLASLSSSSVIFSSSSADPSSKSHFPGSFLKPVTKLRVFVFKSTPGRRPKFAAARRKFFIKFVKEDAGGVLQQISKIIHFYVKVFKLRLSGSAEATDQTPSKILFSGGQSKKESQVKPPEPTGTSFPSRFRVMPQGLKKSRSAPSAVAAVDSPPAPVVVRRDYLLLQEEDGIQSAIAHCKRSFHAERGFDGGGESPLVRSMSYPGRETSTVRCNLAKESYVLH